MAQKFPFELILIWVRPEKEQGKKCMFCPEPALYRMHQSILWNDMLTKGSDYAWEQEIRRQQKGDYSSLEKIYQPACMEDTIHFAAIQLGKRIPVQTALSACDHMRKQGAALLSHVIACTVTSYDDEGDLWLTLAPDTTIQAVAQHIRETKNT